MEIHICSITEYDAETRIPTIANPNDKTFYLVPTEDGTSPDLFTEWVYVNNAWEMFGSMKIDLSGYLTDVQINGTSIVEDGVANVPTASASRLGVIKTSNANGIYVNSNGDLSISEASSDNVKNGTNVYKPITPHIEHEATFFGLAKAAGDTTQSQSSNAVGEYTDTAKGKIQDMLGLNYKEIGTLVLDEDKNMWDANFGEDYSKAIFVAKFLATSQNASEKDANFELLDSSGNVAAGIRALARYACRPSGSISNVLFMCEFEPTTRAERIMSGCGNVWESVIGISSYRISGISGVHIFCQSGFYIAAGSQITMYAVK